MNVYADTASGGLVLKIWFTLSSKSVGSIACFSVMEVEVYSKLDTVVWPSSPGSGKYSNVTLFC